MQKQDKKSKKWPQKDRETKHINQRKQTKDNNMFSIRTQL